MIPQNQMLFYHADCPQKPMKFYELVVVFQSVGIGVENHSQISLLLSKILASFFFFPRKTQSLNMWRNSSVYDLSAIIFVWVGRKTEIKLPSESHHVPSGGKEDFVKDETLIWWIFSFLRAQYRLSKGKGMLMKGCCESQEMEGIVTEHFWAQGGRINRPWSVLV